MRNINESKIRMKQLTNWIGRFEETPQYAQYKTLLAMSDVDRVALLKEWKEYYLKVRETKVGRLLIKQREAFKAGDIAKSIEMARWSRDNSDTILSDAPHVPAFADPQETRYKCSDYLGRISELASLQSFFQDLGEESKDKNSLL